MQEHEIQELLEDWPLDLSADERKKLEKILQKLEFLNKHQMTALRDSFPYYIDMLNTELGSIKAAEVLDKLLNTASKEELDKYLQHQSATAKQAVYSLHELVHNKTITFNYQSTGTFEGHQITSQWNIQKTALENAIGGQLGKPAEAQLKEANQVVKEVILFYIEKYNPQWRC